MGIGNGEYVGMIQRLLFSFFIFCIPLFPGLEAKDLDHFSLTQAVGNTLYNDSQVEIIKYDARVQEGEARGSEGAFDILLESSLSHTQNNDVLSSSLGQRTQDSSRSDDLSVSFNKTLRLGTAFSLSLSSSKERNEVFPSVASNVESSASTLTFRIDQPLLRNFLSGLDASTEKSQYELLEGVRYETLQSISAKILETINAYWEVVAAQKELAVLTASENRFTKLVENTRSLIEAGELSKSDINQPLAQLYRQQTQRVISEQRRFRAIKRLEFLTSAKIWSDKSLAFEEFPLGLLEGRPTIEVEQLVYEAMERRGDVLGARARIRSAESLLQGARNSARPSLNLFASTSRRGFRGEGEKGDSLWKSLDQVEPQKDYTVGVSFSMNLSNDEAKGLIKRRLYEKKRVRQILQRLEEEIRYDIRSVVANHEALLQEVSFTEKEVGRQEVLVANENKKLNAGSSTLFRVIEFQNQLTAALINQISIHKNYVQNFANLKFLLGDLLRTDPVEMKVEWDASVLTGTVGRRERDGNS